MMKINLGKIGKVEVDKKLKARLKISSEELKEKYPKLFNNLSVKAKEIIKESIDSGNEIKTKKNEKEITQFFETIRQLSGNLGVGADEIDEIEKIDEYKSKQMDTGRIQYGSDEIQTIDRDTGKKEGKILLGHGGEKGKLVPIKIQEKLTMYLEHDGII
ncbi:MAG: FliG C-terminal domain-containing protein [Promethearchaeota archaeon]